MQGYKPEKQVINRGQWRDGMSGNPNGRPKKGTTLTEVLKELLDVRDKSNHKTRKELIVETIIKLALEGNIPAIRFVWAYIDGLPLQRQEIIEVADTEQESPYTSEGEKVLRDSSSQAYMKIYGNAELYLKKKY